MRIARPVQFLGPSKPNCISHFLLWLQGSRPTFPLVALVQPLSTFSVCRTAHDLVATVFVWRLVRHKPVPLIDLALGTTQSPGFEMNFFFSTVAGKYFFGLPLRNFICQFWNLCAKWGTSILFGRQFRYCGLCDCSDFLIFRLHWEQHMCTVTSSSIVHHMSNSSHNHRETVKRAQQVDLSENTAGTVPDEINLNYYQSGPWKTWNSKHFISPSHILRYL